ncbi:MAG: hypothetical protein L0332_04540 [Chloroflexi bacterium]|nr:hypothetical protein [Chloroflexota bacterium]MCI0580136.1 hypothetical protein [Chloroflexota bacterium]MCI0649288.1 hypothetical protein [Chloroflexota bacterium]MCI0725979.1 hypothetical protein [Chloroflexota bacterium]
MPFGLRNLLRMLIWLGLGLVVGVGLGLFLGWVAWPTQFTEADPTVLADGHQRDYTVMIAAAYTVDGDLAAARRRLASLGKPDSNAWLLSLTVDSILQGGSQTTNCHLVRLATDLGLNSPALEPYRAEGACEK